MRWELPHCRAEEGRPRHPRDDDDRGRPDVHRRHSGDDDPSADHGPERDRAEDRRRPRPCRAAGLASVSLNTPCNKGTLARQSVVSSLAIPGTAPDVSVGAVPLSPGATVTTGTPIGITWSGCFGDTAAVPAVTGLTLAAAKHALHAVGLTWACYSVDVATTTTGGASTTSHPPVTATTVKAAQTVVVQTPAAGTVLRPGATVSLTMHHCPQ